MHYKSLDILFVVIFLSLGAFGVFQLTVDDRRRDNSKASVAILSAITNTVKDKRAGFWGWNDSILGSSLSGGDQVYTHSDSSADLKFHEGQHISLAPNTLFKITKERRTVDLQKGVVTANLNGQASSLNVLIKGKKYKVESQNAKVQIVHNDNSQRINLVRGEVEIVDDKESVVSLKKNQYWEHSNGEIKVDQYSASIVAPIDGTTLFRIGGKSEVKLKWNGEHVSVVVISEDKDFQKIILKRKVTNETLAINELSDGSYFWHVEDDSGKILSRASGFNVLTYMPPALIAPINNQRFFRGKQFSGSVWIEWSEGLCDRFDLQIDGAEGMSDLFEEIEGFSFSYEIPDRGNYRLRVRGRHLGQPLAWSEWTYFSYMEMPIPAAPIPIGPKDGAEITLFGDKNSSVELSWLKVVGIRSYSVKIDGDQEFTVDSGTIYNFRGDAGTVRWSVKSIDPMGRETSFGAERSFKLRFLEYDRNKPEKGTRIELKKPDQKVRFHWKKSRRERYLFQLSKSSDFSKIIVEKRVASNKLNSTFPEIGIFYWRVKEIDEDGKESYSDPVKVLVAPTPPPDSPDQLIDDQAVEIEVSDMKFPWWGSFISIALASREGTSATINWKKDDSASKYVVEIYNDPKMKKLYLKKVVDINKLRIEDPPEGKYFWRLAIVDHWERKSPFTDLKVLSIALPEKLKKVSAPQVVEHTIRHNRVTSQLSRRQDGYLYHLERSSSKSFKQGIRSQEIKSRKISFILTGDKKEYYRIRATNSVGRVAYSPIRSVQLKNEKKKTAATPLVIRKNVNKLSFAVSPEYMFFSQVSTNHDVDVSGLALNSTRVGAIFQFGTHYEFELGIKHVAGKVFGDNTLVNSDGDYYLSRDFYHRDHLLISGGIGAYFSFARYFQYVDEDNVLDKSTTSIGPSIQSRVEYQLRDKMTLVASMELGFLKQTSLSIQSGLLYRYNKRIEFDSGFDYFYRKLNDFGVSCHSLALRLGLRYLFI